MRYQRIPACEDKPAPTCMLSKRHTNPSNPIQTHVLQNVFINISIKDFQRAKNREALRSGHPPVPPDIPSWVNI